MSMALGEVKKANYIETRRIGTTEVSRKDAKKQSTPRKSLRLCGSLRLCVKPQDLTTRQAGALRSGQWKSLIGRGN